MLHWWISSPDDSSHLYFDVCNCFQMNYLKGFLYLANYRTKLVALIISLFEVKLVINWFWIAPLIFLIPLNWVPQNLEPTSSVDPSFYTSVHYTISWTFNSKESTAKYELSESTLCNLLRTCFDNTRLSRRGIATNYFC